jgi:hypothetical protein
MRMGRAALSIRGRQGFGLLNFHLLFAARRLALAGLRTQDFCPAYGTTISLSEFAHVSNPLGSIPMNLKNLLLQFHRLAAMMDRSVSAAGDDQLGTAFLTDIPLPNLVRHLLTSLEKS